jgi:hypothetical protein
VRARSRRRRHPSQADPVSRCTHARAETRTPRALGERRGEGEGCWLPGGRRLLGARVVHRSQSSGAADLRSRRRRTRRLLGTAYGRLAVWGWPAGSGRRTPCERGNSETRARIYTRRARARWRLRVRRPPQRSTDGQDRRSGSDSQTSRPVQTSVHTSCGATTTSSQDHSAFQPAGRR